MTKRRGPQGPIFLDVTQRRARWARAAVLVGFALLLGWLGAFALSVCSVARMPGPAAWHVPEAEKGDAASSPTAGRCAAAVTPQGTARPLTYAFLPDQSDWRAPTQGAGCGAIDVMLADWYALDPAAAEIRPAGPDAGDPGGVLARLGPDGSRARVLPVLTVSPAGPATPLAAPARARLAEGVARLVADNGYAGLCIDIGDPAFAALFADIGHRLALMQRQTCLVTSIQSAVWREAAVQDAADLVVLRAFAEVSPDTPQAPLAAQPWFEENVADAVATLGAGRLVIALGSFGLDWQAGHPLPEVIGYCEAMRRAARHQGQIDLAPDVLNTRVHWADDQGNRHLIWLLDAVSLRNQRSVLARYPLAGVAIWPLGLEDPGSWAAMALDPPQALQSVALRDYVGHDGQGPFMQVTQTDRIGQRRLALDAASGLIVQQSYGPVPQPYAMRRFGAGKDDMVVLTFDDGPDARYTLEILDILREKSVPAAFFVIGSSLLETPGLVRRMVAEGHEVGSHTFFHPEIETISGLRLRLELNALQRLLGSITGHGTVLFRTPYGRGEGPLTAAEAQPFLALDVGGYLAVGSNIVPPDWRDLGPQEIVDTVLAQLAPEGGNVITLHDGGGDRSATVVALPLLIDALRARGYRFVPLAAMLGVGPEVVMPVERGLRVTLDRLSFAALGELGALFRGIFWLAIGAGLVRALVVLGLSLLRRPLIRAPFTPTVTVVIPAYDEDRVIRASITAALASDYPALRLIVVDDGSRDQTYRRATDAGWDDPRMTLLHEDNQGKWMALDTAIARIDTDIMVALDADTLLRPDAIARLVRPFADPTVGAVAGKVQIGNQRNLLTRLQALEYTVAQNIDRRAAEVFNGLMVVPGAIGAWRMSAVRKAGLYSGQTLAEDADLTVSILRAGYRVVYEPEAISVTQAPDTLGGFMRQRLRWTLGMMQTGWKHRHAAREGRAVGLISIPDLWLSGVVLALLAPIADLVFLGAVLSVGAALAMGQPVATAAVPVQTIAGYLALPLIDLIAALVAFGFERRAPWLALLVPVQRLVYRPLFYVTVYRATWRAVTGRLAGWGKLARRVTARRP